MEKHGSIEILPVSRSISVACGMTIEKSKTEFLEDLKSSTNWAYGSQDKTVQPSLRDNTVSLFVGSKPLAANYTFLKVTITKSGNKQSLLLEGYSSTLSSKLHLQPLVRHSLHPSFCTMCRYVVALMLRLRGTRTLRSETPKEQQYSRSEVILSSVRLFHRLQQHTPPLTYIRLFVQSTNVNRS